MNNSKIEKKPVQMRFNPSTIEKVNKISEMLNEKNKTQIVADSIAVYHEIVLAITSKKGGQVYIEYPDKKRERLIVTSI